MSSARLGRRSCNGLMGSLLGLALGVAVSAGAAERDQNAPEPVFAAQLLPSSETRLSPVSPEHELRPIPAATPTVVVQATPARAMAATSPLPDLDAGELFPAEAFADAADQPGCSTVASLAEGLLGTCLRRGLTNQEQTLTQRLLFSAAQPNRTDAWSRDTESLFRLAQCAGSLSDQRLVAGAALEAATTELQSATPAQPTPTLSESRRDRAQRAQWLWTYRLATLDVTQGNYLRATAALFRLHRTAPTRNLVSRITAARQLLLQLHAGETR